MSRHHVSAELTRTFTGRIVWVGVCETCPWTGPARDRDYQAHQDAGQHALDHDGPAEQPWFVLQGQSELPF